MELQAIDKSQGTPMKATALDPVGKLLFKRSKMSLPLQVPEGSMSPITEDVPSSLSGNTSEAGVLDCVELCRLLLEKVGADSSNVDSNELDRLLTTEYPPRVAELLVRITGTLDKDGLMDSLSDMTESSDDEDVPQVESAGQSTTISQDDLMQVPFLAKSESFLDGIPSTLDRAIVVAKPDAVVYQTETEIALSRIFSIGKTKAVQHPDIPVDAFYCGPSVVTMTGFGKLGRYGNQILQYAFLKSYAAVHNISEIQVPEWIGARLFGLSDREVQRAFPPAVEFLGTMANSTFTDDLIKHVLYSGADDVRELDASCLATSARRSDERFENVDIWGWFQWHTSTFKPFKSMIQKTFRPVPELDTSLSAVFNKEVRYKGGIEHTVVGVHLRYGDYQNIAASSFGYCAPTAWYIRWLEKIWPTLQNPILFVASDDLQAVLRDLSSFEPVTSNQIGMIMPKSMQHVNAGFFPDWYGLTQCDILGISNSTFSFTACMMNTRSNARFFRAHYALELVEIDPWNTDPIIHRDLNKSAMSNIIETLQILYNTQGAKTVIRNVLYELPYYCLRTLIMKAVLWNQTRS